MSVGLCQRLFGMHAHHLFVPRTHIWTHQKRIKDAAATAIIPSNGSASFNALLRLPTNSLPPKNSSPLLFQDLAVNDLPCYALPEGLTRLAVASSQGAVQALPLSASCPTPRSRSPPCRLDWCCTVPAAGQPSPEVVSSPPTAAAAGPTADSPRSSSAASSHGTPAVVVPVAVAASAVCLVVMVLVPGCFLRLLRRIRRPALPASDVVVAPPRRLAPIVTRLLSPTSRCFLVCCQVC